MRERDYYLLQWLAEQSEPIEIKEKDAPHNVRINFTFMGLDRNRYPNAIRVALFDLEQHGLVKEQYNKFSITEPGRKELERYLQTVKKAEEKESLQFESIKADLQKTKLEIDDLVNKLVDYDKVKTQAKIAIICAVVSAAAAVIAILIALMKK